MIFYLDDHPTKCAGYYAVEHLRSTLQEVIQVLSDASRVLIEEWRITAFQRKMMDTNAEVKDEKYFAALEELVPVPAGNLEAPLVQLAVEDQDMWDWLLSFAWDLVQETRKWSGGAQQSQVDATHWLRMYAPRPVNLGRIVQRRCLFPLPEKVPKEFTTPDLFAPDVPIRTKRELTVRVYRLMYWTKYRNSVQYTKARRPRWWESFNVSLLPSLASDAAGK